MSCRDNHHKNFVDSIGSSPIHRRQITCKDCLHHIEGRSCSLGLTAKPDRNICYGFIPKLGEAPRVKPTCDMCRSWLKPKCAFFQARSVMLPSDQPCIDYIAKNRRFTAVNCPRCGSRRLTNRDRRIRECQSCDYIYSTGEENSYG